MKTLKKYFLEDWTRNKFSTVILLYTHRHPNPDFYSTMGVWIRVPMSVLQSPADKIIDFGAMILPLPKDKMIVETL